MDGTATFVTVESSTSINVASDSAKLRKASLAPRNGATRGPTLSGTSLLKVFMEAGAVHVGKGCV
jgi:hypothetical protein